MRSKWREGERKRKKEGEAEWGISGRQLRGGFPHSLHRQLRVKNVFEFRKVENITLANAYTRLTERVHSLLNHDTTLPTTRPAQPLLTEAILGYSLQPSNSLPPGSRNRTFDR